MTFSKFLTIFFTLWIGAIFAVVGWRRSYAKRAIARFEQLLTDISNAHLDTKFMHFARTAYDKVLLPGTQFVITVYQQVKHNISTPVPAEGAHALVPTSEEAQSPEGSGEPGEVHELHATPRPRSFAEFCAVLISSAITSLLALAYEAAKAIQYVISAKSVPQTPLRMDMYDEPDTNLTTLVLELPGLSKDEIDISLFEGVLTLSCASSAPSTTDPPLGRFYHVRERPQGHLVRSVPLPVGTKREDLTANMERGLLTIKFPMASTRKPEKIALVAAE